MLFAFLENEHFSISFQNFTADDDDDDDDDEDHEDNKQLLDEVFAISRIINFKVGVAKKKCVCFFTDGRL